VDGGARQPIPPGIPILEMSYDGSELLNTSRYISIMVPFDSNHFSPMMETQLVNNTGQTEYHGNLNPLEDGIWMMIHDYPLGDQDRSFAPIIYLEHQQERILSEGIIPLLEHRFAFFPDDLPQCFTRWCNMVNAYLDYRLHNIPGKFPVTVTSRNMTMSTAFYPIEHDHPALVQEGNRSYIVPARNLPGNLIEADNKENMSLDGAFSTAVKSSSTALAVRHQDPSITELGDPCNLNNYLPDSGATQHMTPRSADLINVVEGQNLGVGVADGHIIKCSTTGDVLIKMLDDNGDEFTATLKDVMYVPGLSRRLFSITKFARHGHVAVIKDNGIILYFEPHTAAVTLTHFSGGNNLAADIRVQAAARK
jgi:hypothetical protein